MVGCVEGILGLRPDLDGLRLAPAIPREWTGFTMDKDFRGCRLHIRVIIAVVTTKWYFMLVTGLRDKTPTPS